MGHQIFYGANPVQGAPSEPRQPIVQSEQEADVSEGKDMLKRNQLDFNLS